MDSLEIKYRAVADLIPYVNNSRTHSDEQINQIAASMKEFGIVNPLLLDGESGIIAGHGRLLAAKKLGRDKVPTIELSHLSDAQKKAYVIADNNLALNAGWDIDALRVEVETLQEFQFDIDLLGFDDSVMEKLLDIDAELPDLPDGDRDPFQQKTFTLHDEQAGDVDAAVSKAKGNPLVDTGLNDNSNGNALAMICKQWLEAQHG